MKKSKQTLENLERSVEAALNYFKKHGTIDSGYLTSVVGKWLSKALADSCTHIEELHKIESDKNNEETISAVHYTSITALVSMLKGASKSDEEGSLRLYDSVHLNDPDEGNHIVHNLTEKYGWLKRENMTHAYIASFIIDNKDMSDDLAFWLAYGDGGEGCSLLLKIPPEIRFVQTPDGEPDANSSFSLSVPLRKVLYGADAQSTVKLLSPVLDCLNLFIDIEDNSLRTHVLKNLARIVWEPLEKFRYLYKNEAYGNEKEYRFVLIESEVPCKDKIQFQDQDQNNFPACIRHYCTNDALLIKELLDSGSLITLGPSCKDYSYNMKYYLGKLLKELGRSWIEIKTSRIPYRKF